MISFLYPTENSRGSGFLCFLGIIKGTWQEVGWVLGFARVKKNLTHGQSVLNSIKLLFDVAIFFDDLESCIFNIYWDFTVTSQDQYMS